MPEKVREVVQRLGRVLQLNVGEDPVELELVLVLDWLPLHDLPQVFLVKRQRWLAVVRGHDILILNS